MIVYVRTHEHANAELARLFFSEGNTWSRTARIVGFDAEWRPRTLLNSSDNPVALIQIATIEKVLLLQIGAMKMLPSKLIEMLDDETIWKAGVNILGDAQRLYKDYAVNMRSCIELSYLARCVDRDRWQGLYSELIGLARLTHAYTGQHLQKSGIRMSNWEAPLTEAQQHYAANDAHAGLTVCNALLQRGSQVDQSLFMFNVIRATAICSNGQDWRVRDPLVPPPLQSSGREPKDTLSSPWLDASGQRIRARPCVSLPAANRGLTYQGYRLNSQERVHKVHGVRGLTRPTSAPLKAIEQRKSEKKSWSPDLAEIRYRLGLD